VFIESDLNILTVVKAGIIGSPCRVGRALLIDQEKLKLLAEGKGNTVFVATLVRRMTSRQLIW